MLRLGIVKSEYVEDELARNNSFYQERTSEIRNGGPVIDVVEGEATAQDEGEDTGALLNSSEMGMTPGSLLQNNDDGEETRVPLNSSEMAMTPGSLLQNDDDGQETRVPLNSSGMEITPGSLLQNDDDGQETRVPLNSSGMEMTPGSLLQNDDDGQETRVPLNSSGMEMTPGSLLQNDEDERRGISRNSSYIDVVGDRSTSESDNDSDSYVEGAVEGSGRADSSNNDEAVVSMSPGEVLEVLKFYKRSTRRFAIAIKEVVTRESTERVVQTQKGSMLVIHNNQMFRPSYYKKQYVVCRCTYIYAENIKCDGTIMADENTGEVTQKTMCRHHSRRESVLEKLLRRKALLQRLCGVPTRKSFRFYKNSADNAKMKRTSRRGAIARFLERKSSTARKGFPPFVDWARDVPGGVRCLLDTGGDKDIVIIGWQISGALQFVQNAKIVNVDGLMSRIPTGFKQLLILSTQIEPFHKIVPLYFFLCDKKNLESYRLIFERAKHQGLYPTKVVTDFEQTIADAAVMNYGNIEVVYCNRHMRVSWTKKLNEVARMSVHKNLKLKKYILKCFCIAFAPLNKVREYFEYLCEISSEVGIDISAFNHYLDKYYIGITTPPMFALHKWNCWDRSKNFEDFTNNSAESFNSLFSREMSMSEDRFVTTCIKKSDDVCREIYQDIAKRRVEAQRNGYVQCRDVFFHADVQRTYNSPVAFFGVLYQYMRVPSLH